MDAKSVDIPDPNPLKDIASYIATVGVAGVGWLWRQVSSRATKAELAAAIKEFKEQRDASHAQLEAHRKESRDSSVRIYDKLDEVGKQFGELAKEVGQLQGAAKTKP